LKQENVLIIADDLDFAHSVMGRWQSERQVPAFTLIGSESWRFAPVTDFDLAVTGPIDASHQAIVLEGLNAAPAPVVGVTEDRKSLTAQRRKYPRMLWLCRYDGWVELLVLLCREALRRAEAQSRAQRAEAETTEVRRHATLGRYMLEMRHSLSNALTSVLGHSELLLLEPGALSAPLRDQVDTIHHMAMRINEVMQRFSSLDAELKFAEKKSQGETVCTPTLAVSAR
jgi:signal transduction histidine kinase